MASQVTRSNRIVRYFLFALGGLVIAYAVSDHPLYGGLPGFGKAQALMSAVGAGLIICGLLPRRFAEGILVFSVVGLVMLGAAEIAGEWILGSRYRGIYQLNDRLIFELIPDRTSIMTRAPINGGDTVTQRINSDGFRGPELRADGRAMRVVVYGDSFIHAYYSPWEETFAAQLQHHLGKSSAREIEVINAGVSSYGPDQIALKLEDELPALDPDIVIVSIFGGNDFGDLLRNKLFGLDAHGVIRHNTAWELEPYLEEQWAISQHESILKRAAEEAVGRMRSLAAADTLSQDSGTLPNFLNLDFLVEEAEREYRSFVVEKSNVISNTHIDYYGANLNLTPDSESVHYQSNVMHQVVENIAATTEAAGVPLVFMFIPHPFDVTDSYDDWRLDSDRYPNYDPRNQIRILEQAAQSVGAPYLSLFDHFRSKDANELYFHGGDDHWNGKGQEFAARLMTQQLRELGLQGN